MLVIFSGSSLAFMRSNNKLERLSRGWESREDIHFKNILSYSFSLAWVQIIMTDVIPLV